MTNLRPFVWAHHITLLLAGLGLLTSACATEVVTSSGSGGSGASHNSGGNNNTGGNNTGAGNTGGNNTGGSTPVDCFNANNGDPCASPGSYCSYYDAGTNEYCDAYCENNYWQKTCYTEPTYCYNPSFCPSSLPANGTPCTTTDECEYYECEFNGLCGGGGYGYASCENGYWYTYQECYCYQPPGLCPSSPPVNGSPCATTSQCQSYDCEWFNQCYNNSYDYAYCANGYWQSGGDCGS